MNKINDKENAPLLKRKGQLSLKKVFVFSVIILIGTVTFIAVNSATTPTETPTTAHLSTSKDHGTTTTSTHGSKNVCGGNHNCKSCLKEASADHTYSCMWCDTDHKCYSAEDHKKCGKKHCASNSKTASCQFDKCCQGLGCKACLK
jgi:hypothetical protein